MGTKLLQVYPILSIDSPGNSGERKVLLLLNFVNLGNEQTLKLEEYNQIQAWYAGQTFPCIILTKIKPERNQGRRFGIFRGAFTSQEKRPLAFSFKFSIYLTQCIAGLLK